MANRKITELPELITPADGDYLYIVDISDLTESGEGTSKKIQKSNLSTGLPKTQFTADGIISSFNLGTTTLARAVFWNGVILNDVDWSQTTNIITLTFTPASGDIIKPI